MGEGNCGGRKGRKNREHGTFHFISISYPKTSNISPALPYTGPMNGGKEPMEVIYKVEKNPPPLLSWTDSLAPPLRAWWRADGRVQWVWKEKRKNTQQGGKYVIHRK